MAQPLPLYLPLLIATTSGVLMGLAMPGFNQGYLAWFALVPVLLLVHLQPQRKPFWLLLPTTVIWSCLAHTWFQDLFGMLLGTVLMIGAGFFFARVCHWGLLLQRYTHPAFALLALPYQPIRANIGAQWL